MHPLRHPLVRRIVALGLLVGLGVWTSAPLADAHPQVTAAQMARVQASGPLEAAIADALASAAQAPDPVVAFDTALRAALATHPDGEALTAYLDEVGSASALLDLLVGQLLRGQGMPSPLVGAAPGVLPSATTTGLRAIVLERAGLAVPSDPTVHVTPPEVPDVVVPLRVLSAAQPLGP